MSHDRRVTGSFALRWALACAVGGFFACTALGGSIKYTDPPQGVFIDDWMRIELAGMGKVGYAHNEIARRGDEIHSSSLLSISLSRAGQKVGVGVLQNATETLDGTPLSFGHQMDMSAMKMSVRGVIDAGKVTVTSTQLDQSMTRTVDYPAGAVMTWGAYLTQQKMGYKPGTRYSVKTYDPATAINTALDVNVTVVGPQKIEIEGKPVEAILTTQELKLPNFPTGVKSQAWLDPDGNILKTTVQLAGMNMVMVRTTRKAAMSGFSPPEFFMPTTIAIKQHFDRDALRRIDYVLAPKSKTATFPPPPVTAMQRAVVADDGSVKLSVTRLDRRALRDAGAVSNTKALTEYLTANQMINSDDPAVRKMAREARGESTAPYEVADKLRRYVTDNITDKNLNVGFATASEVCRNREGDCSEHAVLLAALGRACGLPSRVATGVVYVPVFGGRDDIFGFHMWTQFYIGGQWVDFDAALGQTDVDPTHIAFSVDSLAHGSLGQIAFPLVNVIGNLDLTIQRVTPPSAVRTTEQSGGQS